MPTRKLVFGIKVEKLWESQWSFGACLSHFCEETYLYINLFKYSISIGRIYKEITNK